MSGASDRWARLERLYHEALDREPSARAAFLDDACADDAALRSEVESLLGFDTAAERFFTGSVLEAAVARLPLSGVRTLVGRQIHGYEVREFLGAGGMGEVYRATDLRLGRDVALKILDRAAVVDPTYVRRFEDEARSASVLNHPNIVTIYGVGEEHDLSYIAMECVVGKTLGDVIAEGELTIAGALALAVPLADALAAAHEKGIVHRDLKPDNVMVGTDGRVKVLDFGIAKREDMVEDAPANSPASSTGAAGLTEAGQILGTAGYMSPEQARGQRATAASDQFSFGAILYELLTGRRAFERPTKPGMLDAIKNEEPEPVVIQNATVRQPLRRLLSRVLAKEPAGRYGSTRDLAAELRQIQERIDRRGLSRRQALWLALGTTGAVTAAGLGVTLLWDRGPRVRALALLPFANASRDPELEYLCNGLTEALIERIGVLPLIRVMPHSLVSNFGRAGADPRVFAQSIAADSYLSGTVSRIGGSLTVTASLAEVLTGKLIWSNSFTRPDSDIQAVQDAIASEIVSDGIRLQLTSDERNRLVRRTTDNPEAYELYLKALLLHETQDYLVLLQERELLSRAIGLDPKFGRAYAALAGTYTTAAIDGYEPPVECWPESRRNVRLALDREGDLPDGYAEDAEYEFFYNWNWTAAEDAWRLALRSRSAAMYPPLRVGKALHEFALGRTADAVRTMAEVRKLDPLSPLFQMKEAAYLRADGRLAEAAAGYESALRAMPGSEDCLTGLAAVRRDQGRMEEAIDLLRQAYGAKRPELDSVLAAARGAEGYGRIERQVWRLKQGIFDVQEQSGFYIAPIDRARAAAIVGDTATALNYLDEALAVHDPGVVMLKADRAWDGLREHPSFQAVVRKVNLP